MLWARPLRIRLIALAAAYVLALQGIFAAFAPVAAGGAVPPPAAVLCSVLAGGQADASSDGPPGSGSHDCPACIMPGCAGGVPPVRGVEIALPQAPQSRAAPHVRPGSRLAAATWTPQNPRAPPAA